MSQSQECWSYSLTVVKKGWHLKKQISIILCNFASWNMSEQAATDLSCGEYSRGGPWYPLRKWWQPSRLSRQDVGLPPLLEPGDSWWMNVDWLQRSLAACSWPGYIPTPLFVPYISGSMQHPSQKISEEQYKWRVSLDVAHFSPAEISLSVRDGFLEVGGTERWLLAPLIKQHWKFSLLILLITFTHRIVSTLNKTWIILSRNWVI